MHKGRTIRNRRLDRRARRPVAAFLRVVARHGVAMARHGRHGRPEPLLPCSQLSPLFTIVDHCSAKILRLSQCPLSVLTGNAAGKVFTNHEPRDKNHGLYAFHQTRDTNHGIFAARSRLPCPTFPTISRYFPAFPGKKIASAKNETRLLCFSRITKHESRTLLPPDYDFLPIHNASISHYPQEFFGILRIPHKPLSARCPPFSLGFPARAVRRSFRPAGSFRYGQHRMNPC